MVLRSFFSYLVHLWQLVRRVSGDDAYELYLQRWQSGHACCVHADTDGRPLTRREFARMRIHDRWQGVRRCC